MFWCRLGGPYSQSCKDEKWRNHFGLGHLLETRNLEQLPRYRTPDREGI